MGNSVRRINRASNPEYERRVNDTHPDPDEENEAAMLKDDVEELREKTLTLTKSLHDGTEKKGTTWGRSKDSAAASLPLFFVCPDAKKSSTAPILLESESESTPSAKSHRF